MLRASLLTHALANERRRDFAFFRDTHQLSAVGRACSRHRNVVGCGRTPGGVYVRIPPGDSDPRAVTESSMRLAIFSDVHGQVERLNACLEAVARTGADEL
jgi:hypothetical protein